MVVANEEKDPLNSRIIDSEKLTSSPIHFLTNGKEEDTANNRFTAEATNPIDLYDFIVIGFTLIYIIKLIR